MKSKGFTLIELMVVVAIIGILAAIAMPQYLDYITRSKVTEGLNLASAAKVSVSETYASSAGGAITAAGMGYTFKPTKYVADISIADIAADPQIGSGAITITYDPAVGVPKLAIVLTPGSGGIDGRSPKAPLDPQSPIEWACGISPQPNKAMNRFVPANCRY